MPYPQLKLDNQLCFRLYTAARLVTSCYTPYFRQFGITYPQYLVLMLLWEQDNLIVSEITERLQFGSSPKNAVLTNGDFATLMPIVFASAKELAPVT